MPYSVKFSYTNPDGRQFHGQDEARTLEDLWVILMHLGRDAIKREDITIFAPNGEVLTELQVFEELRKPSKISRC
jgi:hypothetical protein